MCRVRRDQPQQRNEVACRVEIWTKPARWKKSVNGLLLFSRLEGKFAHPRSTKRLRSFAPIRVIHGPHLPHQIPQRLTNGHMLFSRRGNHWQSI